VLRSVPGRLPNNEAEVGTGGMLSSLFNILSLFTEDVHISWHDGEREIPGPSNALVPVLRSRPIRSLSKEDSEVSHLDLDSGRSRNTKRRDSAATIQNFTVGQSRTSAVPSALDHESISRTTSLSNGTHRSARSVDSTASESPSPENQQGTVARAAEDSTLAVIPAEAFRRLTKKFPKATAHIVQGAEFLLVHAYFCSHILAVILTRLSRVTFTAAHDYLGLTTEVLRTEKAINDIACHPLPPTFYEGGGLQVSLPPI
jgi:lysophospholipid hydrolase